jgi:hypothetical protein
MATNYIVTGQGHLWIAPRDANGVTGPAVEVGDADNFSASYTQQFTDVYESQTGARNIVAHALTQTDGSVTLDVLEISSANLAKALYGSATTGAGASVTGSPFAAYSGGSIWLNGKSPTAIVVKKGATTLVLGTDYTVDATNGRINFLTTSSLITATTGTGDAVTVDYTHTGTDIVQSQVTGMKDFKFIFEQVNFDGTVRRYELHRVALDLTKTFNMIMTGVNKLQLAGKMLPATEITTAGLSQYFTVVKK